MSDPFLGLNINNLQTISATTNTRLQEMNHSMTKPLMSTHLPQLPQQQMKTMAPNLRQETADEESDERKKFEKYRKFQLQQKRLQEMSFSKTVPTNGNSSADKLMANLIQKVESEAKLDKRINNSHKTGLHVYNQPSIVNSGGTQTSNNTSSYVNQFSTSVGQSMSSASIPSMYMTGQQLPQLNNNFNSFYPTNQMSKPVVESINYSSMASGFDGNKSYNFLPQMTANQTMTSITSSTPNLISNSDPIFSITTTNGINTRVTNSNTEPIPSALRAPAFQKLPNCFEDVSKIPALYIKVWNYVKINDISNVCDTNRLYPVLLSVGLPQTILAKLWSVVNQTIPGQLTRHELNMALALIALIQKSSPNPLEEVYKLDSLPIPNIQFFDDSNQMKTSFPEVLQISADNHSKPVSGQSLNTNNFEQNISNQNNYEFSQNIQKSEQNFSKLTQNLGKPLIEEKTIDDDFDDFKSADFCSVPSMSLTFNDIPKQSSGLKTEEVPNDVTEEEFDDFKSATIDKLNQEINSIESPKIQNEVKVKSHTLSDALMSNISAISSVISSKTSNQLLYTTPVLTISSADSMNSTNSGQNTLGSSPQSLGSPEQMTTFNCNFNSVDKYSAFRELTAETTKEEDFGNFLSHTTNCDAESVDSLQFGHQDNSDINDTIESISQQIIQTCRQIIHKTFNVLIVNHGEDSALEAIHSSDGNKFAFDLLEVYEIVKRVETNLKSRDKLNNNFIKLIEDIDNVWNSITSLFKKASINFAIKDENLIENDQNSSQCSICYSRSSADKPVLSFAGFEYHISCANLWLNCINQTLPQPLINSR